MQSKIRHIPTQIFVTFFIITISIFVKGIGIYYRTLSNWVNSVAIDESVETVTNAELIDKENKKKKINPY